MTHKNLPKRTQLMALKYAAVNYSESPGWVPVADPLQRSGLLSRSYYLAGSTFLSASLERPTKCRAYQKGGNALLGQAAFVGRCSEICPRHIEKPDILKLRHSARRVTRHAGE